MILSERGMQMAKELARELVRVEREKKRKQVEESINILINTWNNIKTSWVNVFGCKRKPKQQIALEPIKVKAPPIPYIRIPKFFNARSNI